MQCIYVSVVSGLLVYFKAWQSLAEHSTLCFALQCTSFDGCSAMEHMHQLMTQTISQKALRVEQYLR